MELESGIYINMFPVNVSEEKFTVMVSDRCNFTRIWEINNKYEKKQIDITLYADRDLIYAYGSDIYLLDKRIFQSKRISHKESPRLTCKLILDGIIKEAEKNNFQRLFKERKGRTILFNDNLVYITPDGNVRIYRGFDIRVIFLRNPIYQELVFGFIVDTRYLLRDCNNNPLNFSQIINKFGRNTLIDVRYFQKDLIPSKNGPKSNPETSRQRLLDEILPFIKLIDEFSLLCDIGAKIEKTPYRIIMGDDDVSLW
ncbi:MAG: hypothetical protein ACTSPP_03520 [Candidatus Heimdallarchaeaceae archaeon]